MPIVRKMKLTGRIIRILDTRTVVINLGGEKGIRDQSVFSIMGKDEPVVDPASHEELGKVRVVKAKVKAAQVFDKFTVATTKWREYPSTLPATTELAKLFGATTYEVDQGELRVNPEEVQAWKAKSEEPVRVGDTVEVIVESKESNIEEPKVND
jgi:hypothetical protein